MSEIPALENERISVAGNATPSGLMYLGFGRDKTEGAFCHICLRPGPLTKEHVPPKAAFNGGSRYWTNLRSAHGHDARLTGREQAAGFWVKTICARCNNGPLAKWAVTYVRFVEYVMDRAPIRDQGGAGLFVPPANHVAFARAIASMILAIETDDLAVRQEDLRRFAHGDLDSFVPPFSVKAFYVPNSARAGTIQPLHGRVDTFAPGYRLFAGEISLPPFGFVYGYDFGPGYHADRLADITHWFHYPSIEPLVRLPSRLTVIDTINRAAGPRTGPETGAFLTSTRTTQPAQPT